MAVIAICGAARCPDPRRGQVSRPAARPGCPDPRAGQGVPISTLVGTGCVPSIRRRPSSVDADPRAAAARRRRSRQRCVEAPRAPGATRRRLRLVDPPRWTDREEGFALEDPNDMSAAPINLLPIRAHSGDPGGRQGSVRFPPRDDPTRSPYRRACHWRDRPSGRAARCRQGVQRCPSTCSCSRTRATP